MFLGAPSRCISGWGTDELKRDVAGRDSPCLANLGCHAEAKRRHVFCGCPILGCHPQARPKPVWLSLWVRLLCGRSLVQIPTHNLRFAAVEGATRQRAFCVGMFSVGGTVRHSRAVILRIPHESPTPTAGGMPTSGTLESSYSFTRRMRVLTLRLGARHVGMFFAPTGISSSPFGEPHHLAPMTDPPKAPSVHRPPNHRTGRAARCVIQPVPQLDLPVGTHNGLVVPPLYVAQDSRRRADARPIQQAEHSLTGSRAFAMMHVG